MKCVDHQQNVLYPYCVGTTVCVVGVQCQVVGPAMLRGRRRNLYRVTRATVVVDLAVHRSYNQSQTYSLFVISYLTCEGRLEKFGVGYPYSCRLTNSYAMLKAGRYQGKEGDVEIIPISV